MPASKRKNEAKERVAAAEREAVAAAEREEAAKKQAIINAENAKAEAGASRKASSY